MNIERKDTPTATPLVARPSLPGYPPSRTGLLIGSVQVLVRGEIFELDTGTVCVLGRGQFCDIVVPDVLVSRRHLEIRVLPTGVMLEDLQSRNGVYVNGARLLRPTLVRAGDHLLLGTTEVSIFSSSSPGSEPRGVPLFRIRKRGAT